MLTEKPKLLLIETSGRIGEVAVAEGPTILAARRLDQARRHARDLAPAVAELLKEQAWRPHQLDAIIVSRGPGSYTGLRVGIVSAQILAYAAGCAVLAVDTFAAIARQAPAGVDRLAILADAQQDKVYVQYYTQTEPGKAWQSQSSLQILAMNNFLAQHDPATWFTGPALHIWAERLPPELRSLEQQHWDPQVGSLLEAGLSRWFVGERDDPWRLEPLYARPSAAEEKASGRC
jgi:tRNA threonylcarbamoyladenosine biosynthesis protein TsaB